jgi:hypothetical protein
VVADEAMLTNVSKNKDKYPKNLSFRIICVHVYGAELRTRFPAALFLSAYPSWRVAPSSPCSWTWAWLWAGGPAAAAAVVAAAAVAAVAVGLAGAVRTRSDKITIGKKFWMQREQQSCVLEMKLFGAEPDFGY